MITELGSETFFIIVIPPVYWCIDKRFGFRLLVITTIAAYISIVIKNLTRLARPSDKLIGTAYTTYTFPSGHAFGTTTFWLYTYAIFKKNWLIILGTFIVAFVSISRVYLNVHYMSDIIAGIAFGIATVVAFIVLEPIINRIVNKQSLRNRIIYASIPPLLLIVHSSLIFELDIQNIKLSSALLGIFLGGTLEQEYINFSEHTTLTNKGFRTIFGLFIAYLAYFGLGMVLPLNLISCVFTSFLGGFTVTFIVPFIFTNIEKMNVK
jgi:hypothetical protein